MPQPDYAAILETCRQLMAQAEHEIQRLQEENRDLRSTLDNVRADLLLAQVQIRESYREQR